MGTEQNRYAKDGKRLIPLSEDEIVLLVVLLREKIAATEEKIAALATKSDTESKGDYMIALSAAEYYRSLLSTLEKA